MTTARTSGLRLLTISLPMLLIAALTTVLVNPPAHATPSWLPPISDLSDPGQGAYDPQISNGPDGTVTAVWSRHNGTDYIVQTATRPSGGLWSDPSYLSDPGGDATHPQITTGPDGTTTVAWHRYDDTTIVQAVTRAPGGAWGEPANLSEPGRYTQDTQVATGPDGTVTAVWSLRDGTKYITQAAARAPDGTWSDPVDLSTSGADTHNPQITTGSDGTSTAVWRVYDPTGWIIQAATRVPDGAWSDPTDLTDPGKDAYSPQIAVAPDGTTTAVWHRHKGYGQTGHVIQAATRAPGGDWSDPADLSSSGGDAYSPQIAVAPDGTITTVWLCSDDAGDVIIQAATRVTGGTWSDPADLSSPDGDATTPQIAIGADGTTTAIWSRWDGNPDMIQAATRSPGGAWRTATDLSAAGQQAHFPQVAAGPDGTTTAVWLRYDGTADIVQSRVLDAGGPTIANATVPSSGVAGQAFSLTVTATDIWSNPTTISWDFGDGGTATGAAVTHAYASPGTYTVTVRATDAVDNTTTKFAGTITISAAPATPGTTPPTTTPTASPPPTTSPAAVVPQITAFKLTRTTISATHKPRATKAVITLTAAAKVTLVFKKKATKAVRKTFALKAGTSRIRLTTRLSKKTSLKPGRYTITVVATNEQGDSDTDIRRLRVTR